MVTHPLGGIRTYLLYNLQHLLADGFKFSFLAPAGDPFEMFKSDVRSWPDAEFFDVNSATSIRSTTRQALRSRRFSLIHSQGLRAGTESALANLSHKTPHIMTLHDVIVPENTIPGRFKRLKQFVAGRATRRIDYIVPVSDDCAANHLEHFPVWRKGPCRIEVIKNGIDLQMVLPQSNLGRTVSLRERLGIDDKTFLAGFFGRFMPQKGFTVLLDAVKLIAQRKLGRDFRLVATFDANGYGREYSQIIENDPLLKKSVLFIESVPVLAPLLSQVDLLVMPSLWEAYGLLAAESMVLGIPVVGSDAIGLREVLRGTPARTPAAGDAASLADAICGAMEPAARLAAQAYRAEAVTRFDNRKSALMLGRLYRELCGGQHSAISQELHIAGKSI